MRLFLRLSMMRLFGGFGGHHRTKTCRYVLFGLIYVLLPVGILSQTRDVLVITPDLERQVDEVALAIIPEAGMGNAGYENLGYAIQSSSSYSLWIAVADMRQYERPVYSDITIILTKIISALGEHGMGSDKVFVAVHGHTGYLIQAYSQHAPHLFKGLILFGGYVKKGQVLRELPAPILTLVGDLDGVTRLSKIAEAFRYIKEQVSKDENLIYQAPVVVTVGHNHAVFSTDPLPDHIAYLDIESEFSVHVAHEEIANITQTFIIAAMNHPSSFAGKNARWNLKKSFQQAEKVLQPLIRARIDTENMKSESRWVQMTQTWLSGLRGADSKRIKVKSMVTNRTKNVLPRIKFNRRGLAKIKIFSTLIRPDVVDDNGAYPQAPMEISARMMSAKKIQQELKNTTIAQIVTCRDLNYYAFVYAYHMASPLAKRRYDDKHRGILFHTDHPAYSVEDWEHSHLFLTVEGSVCHVTSISYESSEYDEEKGLHYCKLLPLSKILEWIYIDSLRENLYFIV